VASNITPADVDRPHPQRPRRQQRPRRRKRRRHHLPGSSPTTKDNPRRGPVQLGTNTTTIVDHLKYDSFWKHHGPVESANQPLFAYTGQDLGRRGQPVFTTTPAGRPAHRSIHQPGPAVLRRRRHESLPVRGEYTPNFVDPTGMAGESAYCRTTHRRTPTRATCRECSKPRRRIVQARRWPNDCGGPAHDVMNPWQATKGFYTGEFPVGNACERRQFQLITPLDNHVNDLIENLRWLLRICQCLGPRRSCRRSAAVPCGYVANGLRFLGAAAGARDFGTALASGDKMGMAMGALSMLASLIPGKCFVAGTQVVVG